MRKNVGDFDRMARVLIGLFFLSMPVIVGAPETPAQYGAIAAGLLFGGSLIWSAIKGFCFVYSWLGISSCRVS
ncbi:MAG: DUF2892 domain-containing protein [Rhodospirillaceae bacterium]|nr:DUF2892 domain-containing protein [Rhodospirillaceae bacterium]